MSEKMSCDDARRFAHEYRRLELADADMAAVEDHLGGCAECRHHFARLGGMLDAARAERPQPGFDPDALFGRIAAQIAAPTAELAGQPGDTTHNDATRNDATRNDATRNEGDDTTDVVEVASAPAARLVTLDAVDLSDESLDVFEDDGERHVSWPTVVASVLVAALVGVVAFPLLRSEAERSVRHDAIVETALRSPVNEALVPVITEAELEAQRQADGRQADGRQADGYAADTLLAGLAPVPSPTGAVRVFANDDARWSLTGQRDYALEVAAGTVLVEFVPVDGATLRVRTPGFETRVLGTIFYVSAGEAPGAVGSGGAREARAAVGVVTGRVEVRRAGSDERVVVSTGQELLVSADAAARPALVPSAIEPSRLEQAGRHVDVTTHERLLQGLRAAPQAARTDRRSPPATAHAAASGDAASVDAASVDAREARAELDFPHDGLRAAADSALRRRDYARAAHHYEELLATLPPGDQAAGAVRLDLARLYGQRLGEPRKATEHLRHFVRRWPDDVAAPSARAELCRLLDERNEDDPLCLED